MAEKDASLSSETAGAGIGRPDGYVRACLIEFLSPVAIAVSAVVTTWLVAATAVSCLEAAGHDESVRLEVAVVLILAFALLSVAFYIGAFAMMPRRMRTRLLLASKYSTDLADALYVGISPCNCRFDLTWDLGFLSLDAGAMRYYGDLAFFELRRDQIESVELTGAWWKPWHFLQLSILWRESQGSDPHRLAVMAHDAGSPREYRRSMLMLVQRVEAWRASASSASSQHQSLGLPPVLAADRGDLSAQVPRVPTACALLTHISGLWALTSALALTGYALMARVGAVREPGLPFGLLTMPFTVVALATILFAWMDGRE